MTIIDTVTLPALSYTGIHVVSGSFKFNYFFIDNCSQLGEQTNIARIIASTVGEISEPDNKVLYPNPTSGQLTIVPGSAGYRTVRILNELGQFVEQWSLNPADTIMVKDISPWNAGVYLLIFEGMKGRRQTFKLIKQ